MTPDEEVENMHKRLGLLAPERQDVETVARYIAACKMGLVKNPSGDRLPERLWKRYENQATDMLRSNSVDEALDLVELLVQPA